MTKIRTGRVVFLSNHVFASARRAGFHWLADAFWNGGWDVTFVTTGISRLSRLRRDPRLEDAPPAGVPTEIAPRLTMYVEPALVHPARIEQRWLGWALEGSMSRYGERLSDTLAAFIRAADLVVFESNASLMMFEAVRQTTAAKLAYRVSDDVRVIPNSPLVPAAEDAVIRHFDCVSVPSQSLLRSRFARVPNAVYQPHGVPELLGPSGKRRYEGSRPTATSIGSTLLDYEFLRVAPLRKPGISFHQVGHMAPIRTRNLIAHGELSYRDAVDFAAQADLCLALYEERPQSIYLAETSNKLALFMALRKRIVAPQFLRSSLKRPGIFFYNVKQPESIDAALDEALAFNPGDVPPVKQESWKEIRDQLLDRLRLPRQ